MTEALRLLARAAVTASAALAAILGPVLGPLAIVGHSWPARSVLLAVLLGLWCSAVAVAPARCGRRRRLTATKGRGRGSGHPPFSSPRQFG